MQNFTAFVLLAVLSFAAAAATTLLLEAPSRDVARSVAPIIAPAALIRDQSFELWKCGQTEKRQCLSQMRTLLQMIEYNSEPSVGSVVRNQMNVYQVGDMLVFASLACGSDVRAENHLFIANYWPEKASDLPEERRKHGFINQAWRMATDGFVDGASCVVVGQLQTADIRRAEIGLYDRSNKKFVWRDTLK